METVTRNFPMIFVCVPDSLKDRVECTGLTLLQIVINMEQKCYKIYLKSLESKRWWKPDRINLQRERRYVKFISLNYGFNAISINIPTNIFINRLYLVSKFIWKCQSPGTAKTSFKKDKDEGLSLSDFKISHKATIFRTVWYWC